MSWAPNRQPVNMAKQPPLSLVPPQQPPLQQVGVVASSSSDHGIAAPFGSQPVWKPNLTQQQPMQPVQQPPPNNWTPNPVTNAFQQQENVLAPTHPQQNNNWAQQDSQTSAILRPSQSAMHTSGYFLNQDNFNKSQQQYPIIQPAYPPPQQFQQQSIQQPVELPLSASVASMSPVASVIPVAPVTYSRQSTQQMDNVQEATDYFGNKPINTNEGWGDWDWNDNNFQQQHHQQHEQQMQQQHQLQQMPQQHQQRQQQQQPQEQQLQDPLPVATSIIGNLQTNTTSIDDSFRIESNDNWQWGQTDGTTQQNDNLMPDDFQRNSQKPPLPGQYDTSDPPTTSNIQASVGFIPPPQLKIPTVQAALETILQQPIHESKILVKPTNLPLNDVSNLSENTQTNNNIPSPVYVSQAKPVPKPPRQFASPPNTLSDAVNSIGPTTPPHAFQNRTDLQPSNVVTVPTPTSTSNPITLPPPILSSGSSSSTVSNNPFKRTGLPQHPRAGIVAPPLNVQPSNLVSPPALFYASPPPPPEDFANPSIENHEVIAPDNSEILHENQEIAPNNDRNEYLQTSHLSEIGGDHADVAFNIAAHEQYNEVDDFPPPGLSRLVLGQPENESRQIPGTEDDSSLNIERQADGEDTDPTQQMRSNFSSSSDNNQSNVLPNQIDIAGDRNLYLVPGESDIHEQRVVTGLENGSSIAAPVPPIQVEQRELELDGENIEDQHQPQQPLPTSQHHHSHQHRPVSPVQNVRDEALDGANSLDRQVQGSKNKNQDIGSSMSQETNLKDLSNISTGNDESDQRDRHYNKTRRGGGDNDNKKRRPGQESKENRYESEESEFSSDRERRRFREGSVRSERDRERDSKERKRRDKREREVGGERDRERYRVDDRENRYREKFYRDREGKQGGRYVAGRYDADSKYETESSTRHDRRRGGDRGERGDRVDREAYEEYRRYRNYEPREERGGHERRGGIRLEGDRRRTDREYREDRGSRRHKESREKPRNEYEEYRKASSRNARESDIEKDSRIREKDPRYAGHSMYSGYSGYGYDPYAAYYYEQMVRTNPQAYSEWYKKYYGQAPAPESITNNGRESVHSGRSSANNEKDRYTAQHHQYIPHSSDYQRHYIPPGAMTANMASTSMNSTMNESLQHQNNKRCYGLSGGPSTGNLSQINQLSGADYYASTAHTYYARSEYTETRPEKLSLSLVDPVNESTQDDPQRLTPHKFTSDHPIVSLGPGLMVTVKPNYSHNGISNVVKIFRMGINDATNKLFQSFPGPLVRGLTHKKTIIEFCEDQIRQGPYSAINRSRQSSTNSLSAVGQANKPSFTLMWNLLILLLRQNGMVVGTDIAELLIKNQQQFPYETPQSSITSNSNAHESVDSEEQKKSKENNPSDPEPELDESIADESDEQSSKTSSLSEDEITEKFRNYLLYGNVNEALEWATDKNLWGHALFLASKVDRRSHANVMMKFANKLSLNDPLQTLYQLMSGRTPSSVTSVLDEKWGDWRPHLSMILSNTSQKPELDRKAITTLGDSLLSRGDLFAAHFCYLMAQVGFSKYPEERNDTLLLQNSVRLVLLGSSHQREFEEFATNESIMMTEVYEYACALNDDKFSLVEFQPYKFLLATRMLDYGYQLKCLMYMEQISSHIKRDPSKYEPSFINQVYELADRLKYYDPVLEKTMDEILADESPNQNTDVPFDEQPWLQELRSLALENTVQSRSQDINQDYQQTSNVIDQQFAEINRQFNELNLQYENTNKLMQEQPQPQQVQSEADPMQVQYNPQPEGSQIPQNEQAYPQFYNPIDGQSTNDVVTDGIRNVNGYMQPTQESYQQPSTQSIYNQENNQVYSTYDQGEQQNYWANQPQIQNDETALPTISMPNSQSQKSGSYDESSQPSESKNSDAKKSGNHGSSTTGPKSDSKNALKGGQSSNQNSGWFGGIWNKLSLKPKNQMILPDDKNPAIVWDADKKKWVNTDGEEQIEENLKPPPKMSDLIPRVPQVQQQHQQVLPHEEALQPLVQTMPTQSYDPLQTFSAAPAFVSAPAPGETPKPPSLQSNMFKMQRNRTLKNSYVDVFNPSGAPPKPTEQVLAPAVPPAAVPSGSFFVPGAVPSDGAYQQHQQSTQEGAPQFYNPNQFGGY